MKRAVLFVLVLSGCGGGNGSGDSGGGAFSSFTGNWHASLRVIENSCQTDIDDSGNQLAAYQITQSGTNVTVRGDQPGDVVQGEADRDNQSFTAQVTAPVTCPNGTLSHNSLEIIFDRQDENSAEVEMTIEDTCINDFHCTISYRGTALRN